MERWEVKALHKRRRTLIEHAMVRFPWMSRRMLDGAMRRPAGSRFRRRVLTMAVQLAWEAVNRRDWDALFSAYSPDVEVQFGDAWRVVPDLADEVYRGYAGIQTVIETWQAGFAEHRFEPRAIMDPGGDRLCGTVENVGSGSGSGLEVRLTQWGIWWIRDGLIVRQVHFMEERAFREALAD